jgi:hypothetical protein
MGVFWKAGSIRSGRSTPERFQGSSTGFLAPGDLHRRGLHRSMTNMAAVTEHWLL